MIQFPRIGKPFNPAVTLWNLLAYSARRASGERFQKETFALGGTTILLVVEALKGIHVSLRTRIVALWKDPVGSNVIAASVIAGVGYLYIRLTADLSKSSLLAHPLVRLSLPGLALILAIGLWHRYRRTPKILVFLSAGGTCRDPMAKAIAEQLLNARKPRPRINVHAAALGPVSGTESSYAARHVIRDMYRMDLLKDHHPELLTPDLVGRADLILVMDKSLLLTPGKTLPSNKTFLLKEFVGLKGDVLDPWPDGKDSATLKRYRECAEELRALLTAHLDRIVDVLEV